MNSKKKAKRSRKQGNKKSTNKGNSNANTNVQYPENTDDVYYHELWAIWKGQHILDGGAFTTPQSKDPIYNKFISKYSKKKLMTIDKMRNKIANGEYDDFELFDKDIRTIIKQEKEMKPILEKDSKINSLTSVAHRHTWIISFENLYNNRIVLINELKNCNKNNEFSDMSTAQAWRLKQNRKNENNNANSNNNNNNNNSNNKSNEKLGFLSDSDNETKTKKTTNDTSAKTSKSKTKTKSKKPKTKTKPPSTAQTQSPTQTKTKTKAKTTKTKPTVTMQSNLNNKNNNNTAKSGPRSTSRSRSRSQSVSPTSAALNKKVNLSEPAHPNLNEAKEHAKRRLEELDNIGDKPPPKRQKMNKSNQQPNKSNTDQKTDTAAARERTSDSEEDNKMDTLADPGSEDYDHYYGTTPGGPGMPDVSTTETRTTTPPKRPKKRLSFTEKAIESMKAIPSRIGLFGFGGIAGGSGGIDSIVEPSGTGRNGLNDINETDDRDVDMSERGFGDRSRPSGRLGDTRDTQDRGTNARPVKSGKEEIDNEEEDSNNESENDNENENDNNNDNEIRSDSNYDSEEDSNGVESDNDIDITNIAKNAYSNDTQERPQIRDTNKKDYRVQYYHIKNNGTRVQASQRIQAYSMADAVMYLRTHYNQAQMDVISIRQYTLGPDYGDNIM